MGLRDIIRNTANAYRLAADNQATAAASTAADALAMAIFASPESADMEEGLLDTANHQVRALRAGGVSPDKLRAWADAWERALVVNRCAAGIRGTVRADCQREAGHGGAHEERHEGGGVTSWHDDEPG